MPKLQSVATECRRYLAVATITSITIRPHVVVGKEQSITITSIISVVGIGTLREPSRPGSSPALLLLSIVCRV